MNLLYLQLLLGVRHLLLSGIVVVKEIPSLNEVADEWARFEITTASSGRGRGLRRGR